MKPFNLTIPKPCHENWDQMSPEDKGRFCGSCQKTVVDFTNMSDPEIAAIFKKPKGAVCGRFHQDQLNRNIAIPPKSTPWMKYFFAISWPAFVLMLKSCGQREKLTGDVVLNTTVVQPPSRQPEELTQLVGMVVNEIDTSALINYELTPSIGHEETPVQIIKGDIEMVTVDTALAAVDSVDYCMDNDSTEEYISLDTVTVDNVSMISCNKVKMGDVAYSFVEEEMPTNNLEENPIPEVSNNEFICYPNPIQAGAQLYIKFTKEATAVSALQLFTATGQRVLHQANHTILQVGSLEIRLPANLSSGVYFMQVIYKNGVVKRSSVVVNR